MLLDLDGLHVQVSEHVMETEEDAQLVFLDVLVLRRVNSSLGHKLYRKLTHPTDIFISCPTTTRDRNGQY